MVRFPLARGPSLTQTASDFCPKHHCPEVHLHPISCLDVSSLSNPGWVTLILALSYNATSLSLYF